MQGWGRAAHRCHPLLQRDQGPARPQQAGRQAHRGEGHLFAQLGACGIPLQVTTLPNGLRVATEANPYAETATVGIWINSGSRFETDANNGTAHFLEHILFKGTKVSNSSRGDTGAGEWQQMQGTQAHSSWALVTHGACSSLCVTQAQLRAATGTHCTPSALPLGPTCARCTHPGHACVLTPSPPTHLPSLSLSPPSLCQTRTVKDLEVEIENMGGSLNAYTGREQTCYYAKVGVGQWRRGS